MQTEDLKLFRVADVSGLYADAFVMDQGTGQMVFASFWGRDTTLQELLARLSLPGHEGGLASLEFVPCQEGEGESRRLEIGDPDRLAKLSGRMPADNLFGALAQLWLYDRKAVEPDHAARRALLLTEGELPSPGEGQDWAGPGAERVWALFKTVSHLPLLDHWRDVLVPQALESGWLRLHPGVKANAIELDLGAADYEAAVSRLIREGRLTLGEEGGQANHPAGAILMPAASDMPTTPKRLSSGQLEEALGHFHGTGEWYRHWLEKALLYTEGVQCFAEQGGEQGAFWFIDIVATEFFPLLKKAPFQSIRLAVEGRKAVVTVEDGNGRLLKRKDVEYTDMQPGTWPFYLTDNVLLLPGEY